jgi:hypothetical protein
VVARARPPGTSQTADAPLPGGRKLRALPLSEPGPASPSPAVPSFRRRCPSVSFLGTPARKTTGRTTVGSVVLPGVLKASRRPCRLGTRRVPEPSPRCLVTTRYKPWAGPVGNASMSIYGFMLIYGFILFG